MICSVDLEFTPIPDLPVNRGSVKPLSNLWTQPIQPEPETSNKTAQSGFKEELSEALALLEKNHFVFSLKLSLEQVINLPGDKGHSSSLSLEPTPGSPRNFRL